MMSEPVFTASDVAYVRRGLRLAVERISDYAPEQGDSYGARRVKMMQLKAYLWERGTWDLPSIRHRVDSYLETLPEDEMLDAYAEEEGDWPEACFYRYDEHISQLSGAADKKIQDGLTPSFHLDDLVEKLAMASLCLSQLEVALDRMGSREGGGMDVTELMYEYFFGDCRALERLRELAQRWQ